MEDDTHLVVEELAAKEEKPVVVKSVKQPAIKKTSTVKAQTPKKPADPNKKPKITKD